MRFTIATLFTLLPLLPAVACGDPCDNSKVITPITDASVIGIDCHEPGSTGDTTTGTTSDGASESSTPTDDDSSGGSTGDIVPAVCIAVPEPGESWGACLPGDTCNPGAGLCISGPLGTLCTPACNQGCPDFKCIGGECRADGACVPPCLSDADCPIPGMVCDPSAAQFPTCVHPPG